MKKCQHDRGSGHRFASWAKSGWKGTKKDKIKNRRLKIREALGRNHPGEYFLGRGGAQELARKLPSGLVDRKKKMRGVLGDSH